MASTRPKRMSASSIRSGRFDAPKKTTRPRFTGSPRNWSSMLKRFLATGFPEPLPRALTSVWSSSSMKTRHGREALDHGQGAGQVALGLADDAAEDVLHVEGHGVEAEHRAPGP